jgi:hypothetical protein
MIRSRPGFSPVVTHDTQRKASPAPAHVTSDMLPAIAKRTSPAQGAVRSPLKQNLPTLPVERMQAQAEAALKKLKAGPEVILNPAPSATPIITSPHD